MNIPSAYRDIWLNEGWNVLVRTTNGTYEIEALDESNKFADDAACIEYVIKRALEGSKPHLLAIWLDGRPVIAGRKSIDWTNPAWIPPSLLE